MVKYLSMKAFVQTAIGTTEKAFILQEMPTPTLLENEILIEVEVFGLNYADVMAKYGLYQDAPPLPSVLGYDVVGRVIEVGSSVANYLKGKRVVALTRFGGYAQQAKADYRACAVIYEQTPAEIAVALATQYCTAYYSIFECAPVFENDVVLIHSAAGGVGTALLQMAKHRKAFVIGSTGSPQKKEYIKELGADEVVVTSDKDYTKQLEAALNNRKCMAVFNANGGTIFKKDKAFVAHGGKTVLFGASERNANSKLFSTIKMAWNFGFFSPIQLMLSSQGIIGVNMLRIADNAPEILQRCMQKVVALYESGVVNPVSGGLFDSSEFAKAHNLLESRKSVGKISVKW